MLMAHGRFGLQAPREQPPPHSNWTWPHAPQWHTPHRAPPHHACPLLDVLPQRCLSPPPSASRHTRLRPLFHEPAPGRNVTPQHPHRHTTEPRWAAIAASTPVETPLPHPLHLPPTLAHNFEHGTERKRCAPARPRPPLQGRGTRRVVGAGKDVQVPARSRYEATMRDCKGVSHGRYV
jgi:hypothetical protein